MILGDTFFWHPPFPPSQKKKSRVFCINMNMIIKVYIKIKIKIRNPSPVLQYLISSHSIRNIRFKRMNVLSIIHFCGAGEGESDTAS